MTSCDATFAVNGVCNVSCLICSNIPVHPPFFLTTRLISMQSAWRDWDEGCGSGKNIQRNSRDLNPTVEVISKFSRSTHADKSTSWRLFNVHRTSETRDANWWLMLRKIQALKLTQTKRSKHKTPLISFLPLSHSDCRHLPWRHEPPTGMRQNYIYFITYVCAHIHQPKHVIRATICTQPSDTYDRELTRCSNFT